MSEITGGKVGYARTVQPAPYESKKAEVELSFLLEEGENVDDAIEEVSAICKEHVVKMVKGRE
jgi:hypothetical protein